MLRASALKRRIDGMIDCNGYSYWFPKESMSIGRSCCSSTKACVAKLRVHQRRRRGYSQSKHESMMIDRHRSRRWMMCASAAVMHLSGRDENSPDVLQDLFRLCQVYDLLHYRERMAACHLTSAYRINIYRRSKRRSNAGKRTRNRGRARHLEDRRTQA